MYLHTLHYPHVLYLERVSSGIAKIFFTQGEEVLYMDQWVVKGESYVKHKVNADLAELGHGSRLPVTHVDKFSTFHL